MPTPAAAAAETGSLGFALTVAAMLAAMIAWVSVARMPPVRTRPAMRSDHDPLEGPAAPSRFSVAVAATAVPMRAEAPMI